MGKERERRAGQHLGAVEHRRHGHAGGRRGGDQLVPLPGRDGRGDGMLEFGAAADPLVEVEARQVIEAELGAQAGPEVLLVHHARRHLPAVGRGEEAVAGHGCGGPGVRASWAGSDGPVHVASTSVMETSR